MTHGPEQSKLPSDTGRVTPWPGNPSADLSKISLFCTGNLEDLSSIGSQVDNTPRRAFVPNIPAAYRAYRNHVMGHLRPHMPLEEMLDLRFGDLKWTPREVSIGSRAFPNNRTLAEVFESFLEKRRQLADVIPALTKPDALLFPAMDGQSLFVSHRPRGLSDSGLEEFVVSRDRLFCFLFRSVIDQDIRYLVELNTFELRSLKTRLKKFAQLEPLVSNYLEAREKWLSQVDTLAQALRARQGTQGISRLIAALEERTDLSTANQNQLNELRDIRATVEKELTRKYEVKAQGNRDRSVKRGSSKPSDAASLSDEYTSGPLAPVYVPNTKLVFLGTDGGSLFGDTGQNSTKSA